MIFNFINRTKANEVLFSKSKSISSEFYFSGEIDVFSDLIWERALSNVNYIDHFSTNYIFLFKCMETMVYSLVINTNDKNVDFLTKEGINWLSENMFSDNVEIQKGKKDISHDRNQALFKIIKEGGIISKGELFSKLEHLINN